jgi:hypothetical protein
MPEKTGKDQKQVFNSAVAATLARYGFAPGAAFGDVTHFDAGYSAAPGGRGQANMNRKKYGPSGDIAAPAASGAAKKDLRPPSPKGSRPAVAT